MSVGFPGERGTVQEESGPFDPADLGVLFNPRSVAVIGASSVLGKWGQMILTNIVAGGFPGKVFPVNPREETVCGLTAYKSIEDIPVVVDLAFVVTPVETVLAVLEGCGRKGVKGVTVITSGFGEIDEAGKRLEEEIVEVCRQWGMRLIGPNTMGISSPHVGLFATGSHTRPRKGSVAFVSQSGNFGVQLIHWAEQEGVGFSLFVGSGNEAMLTSSDYLRYLEHDPNTKVIILYVENVKKGWEFLDVTRRVNRTKPVIVLKGGRTGAGQRASASHTGAMSGEGKIFRAACLQAGLVEARVPSELLDLSAAFSSLPLPKGPRVGIVTLGGGWGVVTADMCNENGLEVPALPEDLVRSIGRYLPPFWSRGNPVDLVGTKDRDAPLVAVEELLKWDGIDSLISLGIVGRHTMARLLFQSTLEADKGANPEFIDQMNSLSLEFESAYIARLAELMEIYNKPILAVSLSRTGQGIVRAVPGRRYSPVSYQTPESAVNVLAKMGAYGRSVKPVS